MHKETATAVLLTAVNGLFLCTKLRSSGAMAATVPREKQEKR